MGFIESVLWLALVVFHESRGESSPGQYQVANVVLNRVDDDRWSSTVEGVVTEKSAFAVDPERSVYAQAFKASKREPGSWESSLKVAMYSIMLRPIMKPFSQKYNHFWSPILIHDVPAWSPLLMHDAPEWSSRCEMESLRAMGGHMLCEIKPASEP